MRKQTQLFWFMLLALGIFLSSSRLNAQQGSSSPALVAQAQEPQPARQPGQQAEQPAQQAPSSQAGQTQEVQTFSGTVVKSGDKYVLQDSSKGTTYDIDHQDVVGQHLGDNVRVKGTLDPAEKRSICNSGCYKFDTQGGEESLPLVSERCPKKSQRGLR